MNRLNRILLDPKGVEGNGDESTSTSSSSDRQAANLADPVERYQRLLAKYDNDAGKLALRLNNDNYKLREKIRGLEKSTPPEGARVLSKDEAAEFEAYRALGKPEEIQQARTERDRLMEETDGHRRAEVYKQAAEAHGYKAPVLMRLASQEKLQIEIREEKVGAKTAPVAYVKGVDDKGKETATKLPDYAAKAWPEFLDSLPISTRAAPSTPQRGDRAGPPPPIREQPKALYASGNPF
jgi:hypothetical protein